MEQGQVQMLLREAIAGAKSGNRTWARECLGKILKADPRNEEAWLWMSSVLDTPAEKRYCLEKVLTINPGNAQAQAGLRYLERQSHIPSKVTALPKRTICPMCGEPNETQAFQCANCGQDLFILCPSCGERVDIDQKACAACGLEIGDVSTGAAYFFHLGELYLQQRQPKRALETWDKTLFLNPDYPRVAEVAADAFLASGQRDLAIQSLERALEETQDEEHKRELRLKLANFHRELGDHDEARKIYQELLQEEKERRESWTELYVELGRFHQQLKNVNEARNYYEMALTLDGDLHDVRFALAEIYRDQGYELRALNEFQRVEEAGGELGARAKSEVEALRPPVPDAFRNRWQETMRGTARYVVAGLVLLALTTGRDWMNLTVRDVLAMFMIILGGYLFTAATATPRNLPSLAAFRKMGDSPMFARMRLRPKKGTAAATAGPSAFARFAASQRRSAQQAAARLRVVWMQVLQALRRMLAAAGQRWDSFRRSPAGKTISRAFQVLGKTRFFQSIRRALRQLFPGAARLLSRLRDFIRGSGEHPAGEARKIEITEAQVYRWIAGLVGIFLLLLAGRFILL